jgi:hypothetical protein
MFGYLQLHTKSRRKDKQDLALHQIFLNRQQLVGVLQSLAQSRPGSIDQEIIDALAGTA